jgi:hypothetical protein
MDSRFRGNDGELLSRDVTLHAARIGGSAAAGSAARRVGGNHCFAHAQEPRRKPLGADALCSNAGSLQKQVQFVSQ